MSVAFRRESDEEHLEPTFELPLPSGPNLVTVRGLRLIEQRIEVLEAALTAARDEEERKPVARDLRYWQTRRATAEIKAPGRGPSVAFGMQVEVRLHGQRRLLSIVGHDEADPASGRIAFTAPLARALMGAEAGDVLPFGGREDALEVLGLGEIVNDPSVYRS